MISDRELHFKFPDDVLKMHASYPGSIMALAIAGSGVQRVSGGLSVMVGGGMGAGLPVPLVCLCLSDPGPGDDLLPG